MRNKLQNKLSVISKVLKKRLKETKGRSQAGWLTPLILALRRLTWEDFKF